MFHIINSLLNPFWLDLFPKEDFLSVSIESFLSLNVGSASLRVVWDALKAFLRGLLIQKICAIKTASHRELELVKAETSMAEAKYIQDPALDNYYNLSGCHLKEG